MIAWDPKPFGLRQFGEETDVLTGNLSGTAGLGGSTFRTDNLAGDVDGDSDFHGNAAGDPLHTEEIISNHGNRGLIDDMMTGYRLKDVIITSFDNADALSTEAEPDFANGNWLNEGIGASNPMGIEPVNLLQGLDAGGMNYAEAVGLDSSTVDVMNNLNSICGGCGRHGTPWQADV